jgi:hypothetical protein
MRNVICNHRRAYTIAVHIQLSEGTATGRVSVLTDGLSLNRAMYEYLFGCRAGKGNLYIR